tara:strand:- start:223 stop:642 length:420 start_codon:yes stop_codon:yes gene_type:complete
MINGIKPTITTKTKVGSTDSFDEAMVNFLIKLEENCEEYVAKFKHMDSVTFSVSGGRKYLKVKYFETRINTDYETGKKTIVEDTRGSIHCFVDSKTGDIFKPAGWRAPYTKGNNAVRGNIFDTTTFEKTDLHGGWLYAK